MTGATFWHRVLGMPQASWDKLDRKRQAAIQRSADSFERKIAQADPEHPGRRMIVAPNQHILAEIAADERRLSVAPNSVLKQGRRSPLDQLDEDERRLRFPPILSRLRHR